jgi:hypothetical protein
MLTVSIKFRNTKSTAPKKGSAQSKTASRRKVTATPKKPTRSVESNAARVAAAKTPVKAAEPRAERVTKQEGVLTSPQDRVVELFRGAARDVPAYREFLTSRGIDSADVKTYADFQTLPLTTNQNYMLAYPLPTLTRDGRLAECEMVAVSSGSTGRPLFWPRSLDPFTTRSAPVFALEREQDEAAAASH